MKCGNNYLTLICAFSVLSIIVASPEEKQTDAKEVAQVLERDKRQEERPRLGQRAETSPNSPSARFVKRPPPQPLPLFFAGFPPLSGMDLALPSMNMPFGLPPGMPFGPAPVPGGGFATNFNTIPISLLGGLNPANVQMPNGAIDVPIAVPNFGPANNFNAVNNRQNIPAYNQQSQVEMLAPESNGEFGSRRQESTFNAQMNLDSSNQNFQSSNPQALASNQQFQGVNPQFQSNGPQFLPSNVPFSGGNPLNPSFQFGNPLFFGPNPQALPPQRFGFPSPLDAQQAQIQQNFLPPPGVLPVPIIIGQGAQPF